MFQATFRERCRTAAVERGAVEIAQPIFFLPHLRESAAKDIGLRKQVLKERGLLEVFADVPFVEQPLSELTGRGPGDLPGCILAYQTPSGDVPRRLGYYPKEQTWTAVGDGSLLWIGVDSAEPPKPEEMARKRKIRGYDITLGDGNSWHIPVIRRCDDSTMLPKSFKRNPAGKIESEVRQSSREHWEAFRQAAEWVIGGMEPDKLPEDVAIDLSIRALSINYRFGWVEQNALGIIGSDNYLLALAAAVDIPALNETLAAAKKKNDQQLEQNSTAGQKDCSAITDQAGATCS